MSHVASVELIVHDLDALAVAAEKCGMKLVQDQKTYKWYGKWVQDYNDKDAAYKLGIDPDDYGKCEHAIVVPGDKSAYEIGVVKNPKGEGYVLVYDFWGPGQKIVDRVGGQDCSKLVQEYALATIADELEELIDQGFDYEGRVKLKDGSLQLVLDDGQF